MNEVTKIHLGRQPFTISVAAHKDLRNYLDAIEKQVKDKDVIEEIELRMAELLTEHGISSDKVVLAKDIKFLKQQLGNPADFKDNEENDSEEAGDAEKAPEPKRLFRDTEDAILAGVSSGLARYFGIDAWIIRILFIIGAFTGGWGILVYAVLWLVVPEAKTPSDRLQMAGKPVTIDGIKEVVERADVKGAARRANGTIAPVLNSAFRVMLKIIGIGFIVAGLASLLVLLLSAHIWRRTMASFFKKIYFLLAEPSIF
jgi:phage shock protein PspC (stress-responsive transcriptional regulator)